MTREEAIRIFRKEIECLSHTKCEDCILEKACDPMNTTPYDSEYIEAYSMAIKALEQEPTTKIEESNFSQEQYLADIQSAYDCGKSVLDKIRAEIVDLGQRTMNDNRASGIWACRDIIDKYKAESEKA